MKAISTGGLQRFHIKEGRFNFSKINISGHVSSIGIRERGEEAAKRRRVVVRVLQVVEVLKISLGHGKEVVITGHPATIIRFEAENFVPPRTDFCLCVIICSVAITKADGVGGGFLDPEELFLVVNELQFFC